MRTNIIYEDKEIIVIHKPSGIATQTSRIGQADVVSELKNYLNVKGEGTYIGVIHRLDQPVEGLLVFAKTPKAAKLLTDQLQKNILKKSYSALVMPVTDKAKTILKENEKINNCEGEGIRLTDYLVKNARTNLSGVVLENTAGAKRAELMWKPVKVMESSSGIKYSLIEVELFTGRHHQIRVQMSHAGMPLLGDTKYGLEESKKLSDELGIRQTALLADKITLKHPSTNKEMTFTIQYPENWNICKN